MGKQIQYMALLILLFVGCEEIYNPKIDAVPAQLVVESLLTTDPAQNFVKLSLTNNFYSPETSAKVTGAVVTLIKAGGTSWTGIEGENGYFTFPVAPVSDQYYTLRIQYQNDTYESNQELMAAPPQIVSLYTLDITDKTYMTDAYGSPQLVENHGREIYIDAPITSKLKYYRFNYRAIIEWYYVPPVVFPPPPPSWFGWTTLHNIGSFNIAGPKEFSVSDKIRIHPLLFLSYNTQQYLDSIQQTPNGWIFILDEYGTNKDSYDFHNQLNQQFSADGTLFDPVLTQVYGNIHCKNDPSKVILGFFDLNSYRQYRYYLSNTLGYQRRLNRYPDISDKGYSIGLPPPFWEDNY